MRCRQCGIEAGPRPICDRCEAKSYESYFSREEPWRDRLKIREMLLSKKSSDPLVDILKTKESDQFGIKKENSVLDDILKKDSPWLK